MGSTANRLKAGVREWYERHDIPRKTAQLIALSGGADSMALLYLLKETARMAGLGTEHLTAAYFNHNLRPSGELKRERELIAERTETWGISLVIGDVPPGELEEISRREKRSLEDTAREARYAFLEKTREERGCEYIVLAHHGNDQAETMVARFFQGAGLAGLKGILPVSGRRIRPLLAFPKKDLTECLKEEGLSWSEDSTNGDSEILRNHLREGLIPQIDETFPGYEFSLGFLSEKITRYDDYLRKEGGRVPWDVGEGCISIEWNYFAKIHPAVREYALYEAVDHLLKGLRLSGGKGRRVPYRFLRPLLEKNLPRRLELSGHGMMITMDGKHLILMRK